MLFEPVDALGVEVVGRLVEQEYVGLLEQQAAQGHTAAFASRECGHLLVVGRTLQGVHGALEFRVDVPGVGRVELVLKLGLTGQQGIHLVGILKHIGVAKRLVYLVKLGDEVHDGLHALAHHFDDGLFGVELRVLLQIAHRVARREYHFALIALVDAGDNLEQRRLTRAVQTDDTYLGSVEKRQVDVF